MIKDKIHCFLMVVASTIFLMLCSCKNSSENVMDLDGNVYKTVKIGSQVWMAENLKVTRFRNGDLIPKVADTIQWGSMPSGAYCNYNNNDSLASVYGRLYNWYAISDIRNIAPEGWHVPSMEEFKTLLEFLMDDVIAAGKMKETGIAHWLSPNLGANNESGFMALPGGYRFNKGGSYNTLGSNGYWWTTTESFEMYAWTSRLSWSFADVLRDYDYKTYGLSVRCVKDK